jgi:hypothetical protein
VILQVCRFLNQFDGLFNIINSSKYRSDFPYTPPLTVGALAAVIDLYLSDQLDVNDVEGIFGEMQTGYLELASSEFRYIRFLCIAMLSMLDELIFINGKDTVQN